MINSAIGNEFALGVYNSTSEHMTVTSSSTIAAGASYKWTASGYAGDRLLTVAWLWPSHYGNQADGIVMALSLVREFKFDAKVYR